MTDRFRPDAAVRRATSPELRGNRGDRLVIDDPLVTATPEQIEAARASFREPEPLAQRGRNSIPKSHRAEGINYVD